MRELDQPALIRFRPPRIAMSLVLIAIAANLAAPLSLHAGLPVLAAITGLAGFTLMIRAWWLFRVAGTAICPTASATTLVTSDVFTISRNPMYLGITMMLAALALGTGRWPFYAATIGYFVVMDRLFCPYEEQKSDREFGDIFANYRRRVRRWL